MICVWMYMYVHASTVVTSLLNFPLKRFCPNALFNSWYMVTLMIHVLMCTYITIPCVLPAGLFVIIYIVSSINMVVVLQGDAYGCIQCSFYALNSGR